MLSMGCRTYLSVHLVVLVVAVDKCYPVVILLYPALALSVPVLPSSLGWDGENAPKTRSFQYIASRALISDAKNLDRHCQSIILIGQSFYGARAYGFKMDLNGYSKPSRHHHELLKLRLRRKFLSRRFLDNVNPREIREKAF